MQCARARTALMAQTTRALRWIASDKNKKITNKDKNTKKGYFVVSLDIYVNYNIATLYEPTNPHIGYTSISIQNVIYT